MKAAFILAGSLLLAGIHPASAAYSVELNGLVCLFSHKTALLVLGRGENYQPTSFTLSEGESQFGIKLLTVDAASQRVQIERHGVKSYLNLRGAPNLPPASAEPLAESNQPLRLDDQSVQSYLASEEVQRIKAGHPVWNGKLASDSCHANPVAASNAGNISSSGNNFNNNSGTSVVSASVSGPPDYTKELWYQDSLAMEQQRVANVAQILSGQMTPQPRTPLTPPGTPSQLVDRDTVYGDHISGLRPYGFVD